MSNEKISEQISKLEVANGDLGLKIAANKIRMRNLVGKIAGVAVGSVVVSKGVRYQVVEILSETIPAKGKPVLSALKIAKNGNLGKRPVEIKGAWSAEGAAPKARMSAVTLPAPGKKRAKPGVSAVRGRGRSVKADAVAPVKRRGRPSKKSLEDVTVLGTA